MRWLSASAAICSRPRPPTSVAPPPPALYAPAAVQTVEGWTGFYLGGNFGAGMARAQSDFSAAGVPFATADTNLWGPAGGAQVGYNWQTGAAVSPARRRRTGRQARISLRGFGHSHQHGRRRGPADAGR